jgi:SAM-dependent methyltransferase
MISLRQHQRAWEDLGRVDPMWAVLTSAAHRHGRWHPAEFFATGDSDIAALMKNVDQLGLPRERKLAVDFGCGVGRLSRALAANFQSYVGVDISEPMIVQAREWNRDCSRCRFVLNTTGDLAILDSDTVDLLYTKYVLQHLPSETMIRSYLREFLRVLRPGGLLVFQLPSEIGLLHRFQPRRRLYTFLRELGVSDRHLLGPLRLTPMEMRAIPENAVHAWLRSLGATVIRVERPSKLDFVYFATR